jgi:hypothetical protein
MGDRGSQPPSHNIRADADGVQRATAPTSARAVPLGLGVHHHHDRVRLHQRIPYQYRDD